MNTERMFNPVESSGEKNTEEKVKEESSLETKERSSISLEIDGKTYELKYTTSDFEYPDRIKNESLINGYKRTVIKSEDLDKFIEQIKTENAEKEISDMEIYDQIILKLSNNKYPRECLTHVMNGHGGDKEKYSRQFFKDDAFLQKVYGLDTIKDGLKSSEGAYDMRDDSGRLFNNFSVFDKKTDGILKAKIEISKIPDYEEKIKNDEVYLASYDSGINCMAYAFWGGNKDIKSPHFGFHMDEPFLKDYIEKSFELESRLKDKNKKNGSNEFNIHEERAITKLMKLMNIFKNESKNFQWKKWISEEYDNTDKERDNEFDRVSKDFKKNNEGIFKEHGYEYKLNENDFFKLSFQGNCLKYINSGGHYREPTITAEVRIPVFINNDEIPQLRWGHAKYSHFRSSKGLNFLEFDHKEFGKPIKEEPSDTDKVSAIHSKLDVLYNKLE